MKVLLDSNVIIAAFAARGLCRDLFEVCVENHVLLISDDLLTEIERNLIRKVRVPPEIAADIVQYLRRVATLQAITDTEVESDACRDADDLKILALAIQGSADCIVTGDPDLLILKKFRGIPILTPRGFWEYLVRRTSKKR